MKSGATDRLATGPARFWRVPPFPSNPENRMKHGVGKRGRRNRGPVYVRKEGPVFSLEQLNRLSADF